MISYYSKLTGVSFRQEQVAKLKPGKTLLKCVPRPDNEYDAYAVEVQALLDDGWTQIGWIPRGKNQHIQAELLADKTVSIVLKDVTGDDKETLGVNVAIEYGDDSAIEPENTKDLIRQDVYIGDDDYVYFDPINHKAYDKNGKELLSGSNAEKMFLPEVNLNYAAKALSKTTGAKQEDILAAWDNKRDLSAEYGTMIHAALEKYLRYAPVLRKIDANQEREHTAKNWMPEALGDIVDKFVEASGIKDAKSVEVRIKSGNRTGIVDLLLMQDENTFTIYDYKIMPEVKEIKYKGFGKMMKYQIQQNFYREIIEDNGYKCNGMFLWNWDGKKWNKIELSVINVKEKL